MTNLAGRDSNNYPRYNNLYPFYTEPNMKRYKNDKNPLYHNHHNFVLINVRMYNRVSQNH